MRFVSPFVIISLPWPCLFIYVKMSILHDKRVFAFPKIIYLCIKYQIHES